MIYKRETGAYDRGYAQGYKDAKAEQAEHIRGRWEVASTGYSGFMRCSACKTGCCGDYRSMNFCPNCGADMREVTT